MSGSKVTRTYETHCSTHGRLFHTVPTPNKFPTKSQSHVFCKVWFTDYAKHVASVHSTMQSPRLRLLRHSTASLCLRLLLIRRQAALERLTIPDVTFSLDKYSDADSKEKFWFVKEDLKRLRRCLNIPVRMVTAERTACTGIEALCIVLRQFAVPDRWYDLMAMFGRSCSCLCNIYLQTLDLIYNKFRDTIYLDFNRIRTKLASISKAIVDKGGEVHNVWAFIDGTVRECCRPAGDERQRSVFNGHKRRQAIKFQTLVTPDGIISHAFGPIEGRRHDQLSISKKNASWR
ncbi:hypothetical protein H257_18380 [Aphanomyces astaci]|uniref:DDE Tnp4 domain-containing protein n=1 Tax=Aphanomyces astaci TaxID=112090 RepID=W4FBD1_APHAT|nr:hypothetical protein H257_18380 [Aphanomyces astaci]ETV64805.1 hypothetical protein H257_18380 [Aphanomyces astaci]|eukprot:XP_009845724.1 hypothetical protein H257_18380 [Aphanomyces astaci]